MYNVRKGRMLYKIISERGDRCQTINIYGEVESFDRKELTLIQQEEPIGYVNPNNPSLKQKVSFIGHNLDVGDIDITKLVDFSYFVNINLGYESIGLRFKDNIKTGMGVYSRNFVKEKGSLKFKE